MRRAVEDLLPREVLHRKKSPYPKTHDPCYASLMRSRMERLFENKDAPLFSLVNREELRKYLEEETPWPWYGQLMGTPQTMAYFLQLDFWLRQYQVELLF